MLLPLALLAVALLALLALFFLFVVLALVSAFVCSSCFAAPGTAKPRLGFAFLVLFVFALLA